MSWSSALLPRKSFLSTKRPHCKIKEEKRITVRVLLEWKTNFNLKDGICYEENRKSKSLRRERNSPSSCLCRVCVVKLRGQLLLSLCGALWEHLSASTTACELCGRNLRRFPILIRQCLKNPSVYPPPLHVSSLHAAFCFTFHLSSSSLLFVLDGHHIFSHFLLHPWLLLFQQLKFSNWILFPFSCFFPPPP